LYEQAFVTANVMEAFMFYIYGLHLEGDDEIRYVGSSCSPRKRFWQHLSGDSRNPEKDEWVKSNKGMVRMKVLADVERESERRRMEQRVIYKYASKGHRLFNERRAAATMATPEDVTWWLDYLGDDEINLTMASGKPPSP
jgi:predicted GIY-YIG superfamily endonuclease